MKIHSFFGRRPAIAPARSITDIAPLVTLLLSGCTGDTIGEPRPEGDPANIEVREAGDDIGEAPSPVTELLTWSTEFTYSAGWRMDRHPRYLADVDGDGRLDLVGFNDAGVFVGTSLGRSFGPMSLWLADFAYDQDWRPDRHLRYLADVDGDGKSDIVAFGDAGVYVSRSLGTSFEAASLRVGAFGYTAGGWRTNRHLRRLGDVNGDRLPDIIGFHDDGVYVSLAQEDSFMEPTLWVSGYGLSADAGGWRRDRHLLDVGDVNGDGRVDIVGFHDEAVLVSLSDGLAFGTPTRWVYNYTYTIGNWRIDRHPRYLADVNGDGMLDIVGFHDLGTYVSLSTGTSFGYPSLWGQFYGYTVGGWRTNKHLRYFADVDNDGKKDIVAFGDEGVYTSLSLGDAFAEPVLRVENFGYVAGRWTTQRHLRMLGDVTGDGILDILGISDENVYVWSF